MWVNNPIIFSPLKYSVYTEKNTVYFQNNNRDITALQIFKSRVQTNDIHSKMRQRGAGVPSKSKGKKCYISGSEL